MSRYGFHSCCKPSYSSLLIVRLSPNLSSLFTTLRRPQALSAPTLHPYIRCPWYRSSPTHPSSLTERKPYHRDRRLTAGRTPTSLSPLTDLYRLPFNDVSSTITDFSLNPSLQLAAAATATASPVTSPNHHKESNVVDRSPPAFGSSARPALPSPTPHPLPFPTSAACPIPVLAT